MYFNELQFVFEFRAILVPAIMGLCCPSIRYLNVIIIYNRLRSTVYRCSHRVMSMVYGSLV